MEQSKLEELIKIRRQISSLTELKSQLEDEILIGLECADGKSKTHTISGIKVTIKKPLYYKLDQLMWDDLKLSVPFDLHPIKIKEEIDVKGYEWLHDNKPEVFNIISKAVTITAGKTQLTIKE